MSIPTTAILKDGDDYYMTHSSFDFQPGLLVWHSKDLRTWRPISHAVVNQEDSIWAPDLVKHQGRFYIYYPAAGTNWVVTADTPHGPWSPPRSLGVGHIDPGHIVGDDGKRYMHRSGGHAVDMSADGLQAITAPKVVYAGWPIPQDWAVECFCLESPKLTKRNGWYYLTSAEGGTAGVSTSHMVVSARSRNPLGPWENSPHNPIIRTWSRDERWWSKGHGSLVEGPGGQWYCVLHGWMNGYTTLGRCTLIEPIQWTKDGWFQTADRWPSGWDTPVKVEIPMNDEFDGDRLGIQWQFFRHYDADRFKVADGNLTLQALGTPEHRIVRTCPLLPAASPPNLMPVEENHVLIAVEIPQMCGVVGRRWLRRWPGDKVVVEHVYKAIVDGQVAVGQTDTDARFELKRVERSSPTLGAKPPVEALVLFDGTNVEQWEKGAQLTPQKLLGPGATTARKFQDFTLHAGFMISHVPHTQHIGQRPNSGVYLQQRYEIQILDSFGVTMGAHDCGVLYAQVTPTINMCYPPLTWQTYDIDFTAAPYDAESKNSKGARCTVKFKGVVILDDVEIKHSTPAGIPESPAAGAIYLQAQGLPVFFRNVWIVDKGPR